MRRDGNGLSLKARAPLSRVRPTNRIARWLPERAAARVTGVVVLPYLFYRTGVRRTYPSARITSSRPRAHVTNGEFLTVAGTYRANYVVLLASRYDCIQQTYFRRRNIPASLGDPRPTGRFIIGQYIHKYTHTTYARSIAVDANESRS